MRSEIFFEGGPKHFFVGRVQFYFYFYFFSQEIKKKWAGRVQNIFFEGVQKKLFFCRGYIFSLSFLVTNIVWWGGPKKYFFSSSLFSSFIDFLRSNKKKLRNDMPTNNLKYQHTHKKGIFDIKVIKSPQRNLSIFLKKFLGYFTYFNIAKKLYLKNHNSFQNAIMKKFPMAVLRYGLGLNKQICNKKITVLTVKSVHTGSYFAHRQRKYNLIYFSS